MDGCTNSVKASEEEYPPPVSSPPPYESDTPVDVKVETPLLSKHSREVREVARDVVTAVTHHDINGLNAVSTVALKDVDVQMSSLSGYETYV